MKLIRKVLVGLAILLVVSVAGIMISATCYHRYGPPAKDRRVQELLLAPLLQSHASLDEVVRVVGIELSDFSVGSSNRSRSETHFSTPIRHRLQENAARYPGVLFGSTRYTMVCLFFDASGRLQDAYLTEQ